MHEFRWGLSESVYCLGLVVFSFGERKKIADFIFAFIFQGVIFLAINYFCQILMLHHLWSSVMEAWRESDHCVGSPWLRSACIGIFGVSVMSDIAESFNMLRWQSFIRTTSETQPLVISEGKIVSGFSKRHKFLNVMT